MSMFMTSDITQMFVRVRMYEYKYNSPRKRRPESRGNIGSGVQWQTSQVTGFLNRTICWLIQYRGQMRSRGVPCSAPTMNRVQL